MALEATDLFVIQRQDGVLLKTTATQVNDYVSKTLDEVTTLGNTTNNEITCLSACVCESLKSRLVPGKLSKTVSKTDQN